MNRFSLFCISLCLAIQPSLVQAQPSPLRFQFREPRPMAYRVETNPLPFQSSAQLPQWLKAWPETGLTNGVELGSRVVLQLQSAQDLPRLLPHSSLALARTVSSNVWILQAPDAWTALRQAERLATLSEVLASYPVTRRAGCLQGPYSELPNDRYFPVQWYLERRNRDGAAAGMDLNVRAAWPYTRGEGVTLAVSDLGIELDHPELAPRAVGAPHHDFNAGTGNGIPAFGSAVWAHGTEVAGLAVAEANNGQGMAGVAPKAQLASWIIFTTNLLLVSDEHLMDMYGFSLNEVSVQNHSWAHGGLTQNGISLLEQIGLANAFTFGRNGRGVVMIRGAGNERTRGANANDDGYLSDPRTIVVGAARFDGRVASYSNPGACVLVGAPSGDTGSLRLFTTDLLADRGVNTFHFISDPALWDYAFDSLGFGSTSASAGLVAGVASLILSANPNLTSRDVQHILVQSARHFDLADPDLATNGAGFRVSHGLGFGVPDAGWAVRLALSWPNRPPLTCLTVTDTHPAAIPDDGLRLWITGAGVPTNLASIHTLPGRGPHADVPTASLPLVDVGLATNPIPVNLTGKGALIQRGVNDFSNKVAFAAQAGAAFAVIYNNSTGNASCAGGDTLCLMGATDFAPIPAVFIGQTDGESLAALFRQNAAARAQLRLTSTNYLFAITNTLLCEHVGVRVSSDHPLRGDLRMTLVSPQGTRSVLQTYNLDTSAGPSDWTYWTTHDFYESSRGQWAVCFSDESAGATGSVQSVSLIIEGAAIVDSDGDGLDDGWELDHFGSLALGSADDPEGDGYSNAREQVMGTDPLVADIPFQLDLSRWDASLARLSWPGVANQTYQVWAGTNVASLTLVTNVPGMFPVTEWFTPYTKPTRQFFQVRASP